eukprot:CAMPEP_0113937178 /NCGR_PEP_ID=MMETSP1339-20121228/3858_1 /TAXON_ID=94617 /ORGANISM="Fibrocapsa japonica" /LENGTH=681 /DNA_ID=CAMNT_0000939853 /DNA_START=95 /DNA_END=2137 /DNA_ORIENTATION=+ /assembly_acc=CAM_ASM_000762
MADASRTEHSTQCNYEQVKYSHVALNVSVDFSSKQLKGYALYQVQIVKKGVSAIVLDTKDLIISYAESEGRRLPHELGAPHPVLGTPLSVTLPEDCHDHCQIKVFFSTTGGSASVQWLPPEQTAGGKRPYLFTQGQAINNRSLFPCQDCPAAKFTYEAVVKAPDWSTVLMSALSMAEPKAHPCGPGEKVFYWNQPVPVSSYLVALVVGELESRDVSGRCRVWAEPSQVEEVAQEYSQTEHFLQIAESIICPYEWGRYDLVCLPPSFPYGGMENPCLTFCTPTTLAGDKSLADVVCHEICHSWFGNLVTNHTWEHFWLNEGWTMWLQRQVMTKIHANPAFFDFDAIVGRKALAGSLQAFGLDHEFTKLVPSLAGGMDPDDAFSQVPYEKGFSFLHYLQRLVGEDQFVEFAKAYVQKFKFKTLTTGDFRDFFVAHFKDKAKTQLEEIDWQAWFFSAGQPLKMVDLDQSMASHSQDLASTWIRAAEGAAAATQEPAPAAGAEVAVPQGTGEDDLKDWSTVQKLVFLDALLDECASQPFPPKILEVMDSLYKLSGSRNSEIKHRWYMLCLGCGVTDVVPSVLHFITSQGRMKFVRTLFRKLYAMEGEIREQAVETYLKHAGFYHPITRKMAKKDLNVSDEALAAAMGEELKRDSLHGQPTESSEENASTESERKAEPSRIGNSNW